MLVILFHCFFATLRPVRSGESIVIVNRKICFAPWHKTNSASSAIGRGRNEKINLSKINLRNLHPSYLPSDRFINLPDSFLLLYRSWFSFLHPLKKSFCIFTSKNWRFHSRTCQFDQSGFQDVTYQFRKHQENTLQNE